MAVYRIISQRDGTVEGGAFDSFREARQEAEKCAGLTGRHYMVQKCETTWTTQMLSDAIAEAKSA